MISEHTVHDFSPLKFIENAVCPGYMPISAYMAIFVKVSCSLENNVYLEVVGYDVKELSGPLAK